MSFTEEAFHNQLIICNQSPLGRELLEISRDKHEPLSHQSVVNEIDTIRSQLYSLRASNHPDDRAAVADINHTFDETDAQFIPEHLKSINTSKIVEWLIGADNTEILEFLSWNVDRHTMQQMQLMKDLPELQEKAIANIDRTVAHGLWPTTARFLARKAISSATYIALDSFEAGKERVFGYRSADAAGQPVIAIANHYYGGNEGFAFLDESADEILTHEIDHLVCGLAGGGLRAVVLADRQKTDFIFWHELLTEHRTQVGKYGQPNVINPEARDIDSGIYIPARAIGAIIIQGGEIPIPLELIGEASLEPLDNKRLTARPELNQKLFASFENILRLKEGDHVVSALARALSKEPLVAHVDSINAWRIMLNLAIDGHIPQHEKDANLDKIVNDLRLAEQYLL